MHYKSSLFLKAFAILMAVFLITGASSYVDAAFTSPVQLAEEASVQNQAQPFGSDVGWYDNGPGPFTIATVDQLEGLDWILLTLAETFQGKVINLAADLDLTGATFLPIGDETHPFLGTFDGNNHIISNLTLNVNGDDPNNVPEDRGKFAGLFANLGNRTVLGTTYIKNLTIDNFNITGFEYIGGVAGRSFRADYDNVHVKNTTITCEHFCAGITGYLYGPMVNSSAENVTVKPAPLTNVSGELGNKSGALVGFIGESNESNPYVFENNTATNVDIQGLRDVGGLYGAVNGYAWIKNNVLTDSVVEAIVIDGIEPTNPAWVGGIVGRVPGTVVSLQNVQVNNSDVSGYSAPEVGEYFGGPKANAKLYQVQNETKDLWYETIQEAIAVADAGDSIKILPGTYNEDHQIVVDKDLTIVGAGAATTIVKPTQNTGSSADARGWWLVPAGHTFNLSGLTLDGEGFNISNAIRSYSETTITDSVFKNISHPGYQGIAVVVYDANGTITGNSFSGIGRIGVVYRLGT